MCAFNAKELAHLFPKPVSSHPARRNFANSQMPSLPPGLHLRDPRAVPPDETPEERAVAERAAMEKNRRRKHHNIICYDDDGNAYQSLSEARIFLDFKQRKRDGFISEPKRGRYKFTHNDVEIGTYTSDMEFQCLQTFVYMAPGGTVHFLAGKSYVCDVKSPATVTKDYKRTRLLMQAFHGITITEILTSSERPKKRRK